MGGYVQGQDPDLDQALALWPEILKFLHQDENEMMVLNNLDSQMHERTLVDANITFRNADETYYVAIWGKNLTDERYRHGANPVAGLWNFTQYGEPRTFGLELGVSLGQ